MQTPAKVAWALGVVASIALTWSAAQGPPPPRASPTPPPLARPASPLELAALDQACARLEERIALATSLTGRPVPVDALEGSLPDGTPILEGGIPDNPLVPGVGAVVERCGGEQLPEGFTPIADWYYCPETGQFDPGGT